MLGREALNCSRQGASHQPGKHRSSRRVACHLRGSRSVLVHRAAGAASCVFACGVAGITRTGPRIGRGRFLPPDCASSVAEHPSRTEPARTRDRGPPRRAARSRSVRIMVFTLPIPLLGRARKEEGENSRVERDRRQRHLADGVTPVEQYAGPAVKTSNPGLAPRGAERAVGGIRAWGENPAAGPAHLRLYSHSRRLRARIQKFLESPARGGRRPPAAARLIARGRGTMELRHATTAIKG